MASAPSAAMISFQRSVTSAMASSQDARRNRPEPLAPVRTSGCVRRSGECTRPVVPVHLRAERAPRVRVLGIAADLRPPVRPRPRRRAHRRPGSRRGRWIGRAWPCRELNTCGGARDQDRRDAACTCWPRRRELQLVPPPANPRLSLSKEAAGPAALGALTTSGTTAPRATAYGGELKGWPKAALVSSSPVQGAPRHEDPIIAVDWRFLGISQRQYETRSTFRNSLCAPARASFT